MVMTAMVLPGGVARLCLVGMAQRATHHGNEGSCVGVSRISRPGSKGPHRDHDTNDHGKRRQQDGSGPVGASHAMRTERHHSRIGKFRAHCYALQGVQAIGSW